MSLFSNFSSEQAENILQDTKQDSLEKIKQSIESANIDFDNLREGKRDNVVHEYYTNL